MRRQELHPRTAVINKTQKNLSRKARCEALNWLAATFPDSFDNTMFIQPLKAGIMEDILLHADKAMEAGISRSKLRQAVVVFTRRIDYLACLKAREMRVDLNGNPITPVTSEEAQNAAQTIKKRIEKSIRNARRAADDKMEPTDAKPTNNKSTTPATPFYSTNGNPYLVERPPMFSAQQNTVATTKSTVIVKKSTRQYDPDAVAKLKEKLGLSRKADGVKAD